MANDTKTLHLGIILNEPSNGDFRLPKMVIPLDYDLREHDVFIEGDSFLTWGEWPERDLGDHTLHIVIQFTVPPLDPMKMPLKRYLADFTHAAADVARDMIPASLGRLSDFAVVTDQFDWSEDAEPFIAFRSVV